MKRKPKFSGFSWSTLKALSQYTLLSNPETQIHFVIPQHHRALVKAGELTLSYYLNCQLVKKKIRQNDKLKGTICNSLKGYFNLIYSHIFFFFPLATFFLFHRRGKAWHYFRGFVGCNECAAFRETSLAVLNFSWKDSFWTRSHPLILFQFVCSA